MIIQDQVMDARERIGFRLRELYQSRGFSRYRMSKFEEYDLYSRNKDFLFSEAVITFTDTGGRLMALKPDVTLSIIKNGKDRPGELRKVYYHENVYRVSPAADGFREQTQVGLECIGAVDGACLAETLRLAADSLALCREPSALAVSHLGILKAMTDGITDRTDLREALLACAGEKNLHGISALCRESGIAEYREDGLLELLRCFGEAEAVLPRILRLAAEHGAGAEAEELDRVIRAYRQGERSEGPSLQIDFSATGDLKYYNGIVFKGYIDGIPDHVLSGGQYDTLMRRMGRKDRAIGFAVFLDLLERLPEEGTENA